MWGKLSKIYVVLFKGVIDIIRHITTKTLFEKIKKTGYICPAGSGVSVAPEKDYVAFETYKENKAFYKAIYNGKSSSNYNLQKNDLVGLWIDKEELVNDGFCVIEATALYEGQHTRVIDGKKFTTKWENYTSVQGREILEKMEINPEDLLSREEFNNIGEYVFVQGCIPVKYIKDVEEW
jgi:hypothetical protein